MAATLRRDPVRVLGAAGVVAALALIVHGALGMRLGLDYFYDAETPIDALVRGDVHGFLVNPALMGSFSLLLRAPFVAVVFHGSEQAVYLAGVLPCMAALLALAIALRRRMLALGRPALAATLVAVLVLVNPASLAAVHWGHPEDLLGAALCVGAALLALRGRWLTAGIALGLALATKQWAVVAIAPVLLAAPRRQVALGLVALALAAALTLPSLIVAPAQMAAQGRALADGSAVANQAPVDPVNVWWPFSSPRAAAERNAANHGFGYAIPTWLGNLTHPLAVAAGLPFALLFWRRRRQGLLAYEDALALLALAMLLRCLLDPWNNDYYALPFLLSLVAWDAVRRDGWPRLTLVAGVALAVSFPTPLESIGLMVPDALRYNLVYLATMLPLCGYLGLALFAPARLAALRVRASSGPPGTAFAPASKPMA